MINRADLRPSSDSKVQCHKKHLNSFGLMPGPEWTCPYATTGDGGCFGNNGVKCYAHKLARLRPNVSRVLEANSNSLKDLDRSGMVELLDNMFEKFRKSIEKYEDGCNIFRLHWSGDIFSVDYAEALAESMRKYPDITFWTYTRSLGLITNSLMSLNNLSLFISLDICNLSYGLSWIRKLTDRVRSEGINVPRIAYMGDYVPDELKEYAEENRCKIISCSADEGLVNKVGACPECRLCINKNESIIFFKTR